MGRRKSSTASRDRFAGDFLGCQGVEAHLGAVAGGCVGNLLGGVEGIGLVVHHNHAAGSVNQQVDKSLDQPAV